MKRILATAMALTLTLSCFGGTLAEESGTAPDRPAVETSAQGERLQVLVEKGIISQETLEAILTYLEANQPEAPQGQGAEQPPEKPEGQQPGNDGDKSQGQPPQGGPSGDAPQMPEGQQPDSMGMLLPQDVLDQLLKDGILTQSEYDAIEELQQQSGDSVAPGGNAPDGNAPGGNAPGGNAPGGNAPGGASAQDVTYAAATSLTSGTELEAGEYTSETADENAILIDTDESVTLNQPTVTKTGDSDGGDNCNFYGLNAAVLAMGGADVTISGGAITTDGDGANGVFSYGGNGGQNGAAGDGTTVTISDTTITTTGDGSGGIMTTGGGVTIASNLTIETSGRSSAAIRTDRGGGTVTVDGGSYTTNGLGSPAIYSTADISVANAQLVSNLSEGVCIEGKNSIALTDCDLTASNTQCNGNATFLDSIMIYQSMSGDADSGTSAFTMTGGSLTSKSGHVFHVTNTHAIITLTGVEITNEDAENVLLSVCDDGWNGAGNQAEVNAFSQVLEGSILVGDNASLSLSLSEGSTFTGSISGEITNSRGETVSTQVGEVSVTLDGDSTWTLTGDSCVTSFTGDAAQVISGGYTLYVNGVALEGTR
ncbi:MAG: hypothetical protein MR620_08025 [Clostridiales bacterium]|nr:hypothetical protein [Clostridiales bacterium]